MSQLFVKKLVLRENDLLELPDSIGNLKPLKELHIQSNRLQLMPLGISKLDIFNSKSILKTDNNLWLPPLAEAIKIGLNNLLNYLTCEAYEM